MKTLLKIVAFALLALVIAALLVLPATQTAYAGVYEKTLRFHVLANSDSVEDQALKMRVKEELIDYIDPLLSDCTDAAATESRLRSLLPQIEQKAYEVLKSEGSEQSCKVVLGEEFYPTRRYETLSYPAGEYRSLRVYLGSGEGQNWWCVLFPPLCLDASNAAAEMSRAGYSEDEQALVTQKDEGYTVRFFILDIAAKLKRLFS